MSGASGDEGIGPNWSLALGFRDRDGGSDGSSSRLVDLMDLPEKGIQSLLEDLSKIEKEVSTNGGIHLDFDLDLS